MGLPGAGHSPTTMGPTVLTQPRGRVGRRLTETQFALLLHAPWMILTLILVGYPIVDSFWTSLQQADLKMPTLTGFVGLQNYLDVLGDPYFQNSLVTTAILTVCTVVGVTILGLAFGLVLNEAFKGRGLLRALVLVPWAIPGVVNASMWQWILDPSFGALNGLAYDLGLIHEYRSWILDPVSMYGVLVAANLWNTLPFPVLIVMAGLQAIPAEMYDAAQVDGAGMLARFRHLTLPWLIHPLLLIIILGTIGGIRIFDIIYIITGGGPGTASTTIAFAAYRVAFDQLNFGVGNSYAYIMFLLTLALSVFYVRVLYRRGEISL